MSLKFTNLLLKLFFRFIFLLYIFTCGSCISIDSSELKSNKNNSQDLDAEKDEIENLNTLLDKNQFEQLQSKCNEFIKAHPFSIYLNEVTYLLALSYEYFQDWTAAISNYNFIIANSINGAKEFLSLSLYRKSICFQALQENEKAIASLKDALNRKEYLPLEVSEAQIPARLASLYASLNQKKAADYFNLQAELGIRYLKNIKKASDQNWLAETLFQMGTLQNDQLDEENFNQNLLSFSRQQKYLLQTIELANPKWSPKAKDQLIQSYSMFLNLIKNFRVNKSDDWAVDQFEISEKKSNMAASIDESMALLKSYEAPKETVAAQRTEALFDLLKPIENEVLNLIQIETRNKPWDLSKNNLQSESINGAIDFDLSPNDSNIRGKRGNLPSKKSK